MRISILTPNLPPLTCGLADHSRLLGAALADLDCTVALIGLRGNPVATAKAGWRGAACRWNGRANDLLRLLAGQEPEWIWVQLSGYGYSRWGAPWQLGSAIRAAKRELGVRVVICVHETHCAPEQLGLKGPWLSRWQRATVGRVVRLGDLVFPTIPLWVRRCESDYGVDPRRITLLPVAANLPSIRLEARERARVREGLGIDSDERVAITFGTWESQLLALQRFSGVIDDAIRRGVLHRILAVGGQETDVPPGIASFAQSVAWADRLKILGPKAPDQAGSIIASADVGLVPTPWEMWKKSGAARAMEQAGLVLWILDGGKVREKEPAASGPTWEGSARTVLARIHGESAFPGP